MHAWYKPFLAHGLLNTCALSIVLLFVVEHCTSVIFMSMNLWHKDWNYWMDSALFMVYSILQALLELWADKIRWSTYVYMVRYFQGTEYSSQSTKTFSCKKAVTSVGVRCIKFVHWLPTIREHKLAIVATLQDSSGSLFKMISCPPRWLCF